MTTFATDTFSLPYPDAAEPPNGPQQIQDLASETETTLRQLLAGYAGLLQDGVVEQTDCMVEHTGPPARSVQVAGGLAIVDNSITVAVSATVAIDPAHATLPRIDRIVLSAAGEFSALTGSPTSGATIDNADTHGAVDPTGHGLLLADVHVPAAATTIDNTQIRDRRPWARSARAEHVSISGDSYATTSLSLVEISADMRLRVECSGKPVLATFDTTWIFNSGTHRVMFDLLVDGVGTGRFRPGYGGEGPINARWRLDALAAGSHVFSPAWKSFDGTSVGVPTYGSEQIVFAVQEIDVTANNTITSG